MDEYIKYEIDRANEKIQELHNYVRFIMQQTMGWFTFFVTVNYASMGWFAKSDVSAHGLVNLVRWMFIAQNFLGIATCILVRQQVFSMGEQICSYENFIDKLKSSKAKRCPRDECMPNKLFLRATLLMVATQVIIIIAWLAFSFFL